jgi:hypothetical protein
MSIFDSKVKDKISSTLYDLTHLEINTIIKDEMSASKAPSSPRLLLHNLAVKYDLKLVSLGDIYSELETFEGSEKKYFNEKLKMGGSGVKSFLELRDRARMFHETIKANEAVLIYQQKKEGTQFTKELIDADIKMLQRIEAISNDIRNILSIKGVLPEPGNKHLQGRSRKLFRPKVIQTTEILDFDDTESISKFRVMSGNEAEQQELNLDLRQLLVIKKANDIGTEKVVLQTIIGIDGDVTTRISQSFAKQPVSFINEMHHEATDISVKFWENLVNVVVKLGESIFGSITKKS